MQEMKDEEVQDSPRSCVIPPPCKPPRSWDLIQSGVIDDPKVGSSMYSLTFQCEVPCTVFYLAVV